MTLRARRGLFLAAAVLTAGASALPLWGFRMSAPQYPGESLHLRVATSGISGDVQEVSTLQKYIGVQFPRRLPELRWMTPVLVGLAFVLAGAVGAGETRWGRVSCSLALGALLLFLAASAALLQVRLYALGHERDRTAPIRAVHDFTPPFLGATKVGNFTVWSYPHVGGCGLAIAALLAFVGTRQAFKRSGAPATPAASPRESLVATIAVILGLALVSASPAAARTWTVGGPGSDFPLLGPALAAAGDGDEVRIGPGVYREDLVLTRRVSLRGEGWPVVMGTGEGAVIEVRAPGCEIRGLAIEGSGTGSSGRMDAGIMLLSNRNRVAGNRMRRVFYGIVMAGSTENEIRGNEIAGFLDLPYSRRGDGIYAYRAPRNRIFGNHVIGERDGIYFQYAPGAEVADNVVERCRYGLHHMFSDDAVIARNTFRRSSAGANIMNSRRVRLAGNTFAHNRGVSAVGLSLKECDESTVERNVVRDNASGMKIEGASKNRFVANDIVGNDRGISLFASAEENVFTRNSFLGNGSDVVLRGSGSHTRWSEDGTGNFWEGYRGLDVDGDGRGETAHPILGAFERLEGNNPATRLFLRSPAASALELASRFAPDLREEVADPAPLVRPDPAAASPAPARRAGGIVALISVGLLAGFRRGGRIA